MTCPTPRFLPPRRQRGVAAILLVIFVGLALIVTVHGVFRAVRSAQEQTLAQHAQTPAQATAWAGVESMRRYLDVVDRRTVLAWAGANPTPAAPVGLTLTGAGATNLEAQITNVTKVLVPADPTNPLDNDYTITARVVGRAGSGAVAAASPVEVVYGITLMTANPNPAADPPSMNFFKDVEISGDVKFSGAEHAQINVLGNVTITSTNLTGVEQVNATGNVSVNSAVKLDQVHSNGNVSLTQGADSKVVKAQGTVLLSGGGRHGYIQADKTVTFESTEALKVDTRGDLVTGEDGKSCQDPAILNYDGTYIGEARVHGAVQWHSCGGGVKDLLGNSTLYYRGSDQLGKDASGNGTRYQASQHLRTRSDQLVLSAEETGRYTSLGKITHNTGANSPVVRYCAQTELAIPQYMDWGSSAGVKGYGTTIAVGDARNNANIKLMTDAPAGACDFDIGSADVPLVPPYTRDKPVIDANALKGQANLAFELDAAGDLQVTVKSINKSLTEQVPDGIYTLGYKDPPEYAQDTPDWLCRKDDLDLTGSPDSTTKQRKCNAPIVKLCENDLMESCFKYSVDPDTHVTKWTLNSWNSPTIFRGVIWMDGDAYISAKGYVDTIIVTGNIDVVNGSVLAPNYAGYDVICKNATFKNVHGQDVSSPDLAGVFATNFCNSSGTLIPNRMGNVALIAGSYDGDVFSGGNIRTTGGSIIRGSVMAGNKVIANEVGANTSVSGNIIGAGQAGDADTGPSGAIGRQFRLDFPSIPGYDPGLLPCASKGCMSNQAQVQWARYQ